MQTQGDTGDYNATSHGVAAGGGRDVNATDGAYGVNDLDLDAVATRVEGDGGIADTGARGGGDREGRRQEFDRLLAWF